MNLTNESKIVVNNRAYKVSDLINYLSCLSGMEIAEFFSYIDFKLPKAIKIKALKDTLLEPVLELRRSKLTVADERKYRLTWFQTFSEYQLENLLEYFNDNELNLKYLKKLWLNILDYMIAQKISDQNFLRLINIAENTEQKVPLNFLRFNLILNKVFVDDKGQLDGLTIENFRPVLYKSSTIKELRELGAKYDIKVPQRLKKDEFVFLIIKALKEKHEYVPGVEKELASLRIPELQRFCAKRKLIVSPDLNKAFIIEYILSNAKETKGIYNKPSSDAIYMLEVDDIIKDNIIIEAEERGIQNIDLEGRIDYQELDRLTKQQQEELARKEAELEAERRRLEAKEQALMAEEEKRRTLGELSEYEKELANLRKQREQAEFELSQMATRQGASSAIPSNSLVEEQELKETNELNEQIRKEKESLEEAKKQQELEAEKKRQEIELEQERRKKEIELETERKRREIELEAERKQKEFELEEIRRQKELELQEEKRRKDEELARIKKEREAELAEAKRKQDEELERFLKQREQELEEAKKKQEQELEELRLRKELELDEANKKREALLKEEQRRHEEELAELNKKREEELARIKEEKELAAQRLDEEALLEIRKQRELELAEAKRKQEAEIEEARKQIDQELLEARKQREELLRQENLKHEQELEELNKLKAEELARINRQKELELEAENRKRELELEAQRRQKELELLEAQKYSSLQASEQKTYDELKRQKELELEEARRKQEAELEIFNLQKEKELAEQERTFSELKKQKELELAEARKQHELELAELNSKKELELLEQEKAIEELKHQRELELAQQTHNLELIKKEKEAELLRQTESLELVKKEREEELARQNALIADLRQQQLSESEELTKQKAKELANKEKELEELANKQAAELALKETQLAELRKEQEEILADHEKQIAELKAQRAQELEEQDAALAEIKRQKEEEIEKARLDKEKELEAINKEKEAELEEQAKTIEELKSLQEEEFEKYTNELEELKKQKEAELNQALEEARLRQEAELAEKEKEFEAEKRRQDEELAESKRRKEEELAEQARRQEEEFNKRNLDLKNQKLNECSEKLSAIKTDVFNFAAEIKALGNDVDSFIEAKEDDEINELLNVIRNELNNSIPKLQTYKKELTNLVFEYSQFIEEHFNDLKDLLNDKLYQLKEDIDEYNNLLDEAIAKRNEQNKVDEELVINESLKAKKLEEILDASSDLKTRIFSFESEFKDYLFATKEVIASDNLDEYKNNREEIIINLEHYNNEIGTLKKDLTGFNFEYAGLFDENLNTLYELLNTKLSTAKDELEDLRLAINELDNKDSEVRAEAFKAQSRALMEEELARKQAEIEEAKRQQEEELAKKQAEVEEAKRLQEEELARKQAELEAKLAELAKEAEDKKAQEEEFKKQQLAEKVNSCLEQFNMLATNLDKFAEEYDIKMQAINELYQMELNDEALLPELKVKHNAYHNDIEEASENLKALKKVYENLVFDYSSLDGEELDSLRDNIKIKLYDLRAEITKDEQALDEFIAKAKDILTNLSESQRSEEEKEKRLQMAKELEANAVTNFNKLADDVDLIAGDIDTNVVEAKNNLNPEINSEEELNALEEAVSSIEKAIEEENDKLKTTKKDFDNLLFEYSSVENEEVAIAREGLRHKLYDLKELLNSEEIALANFLSSAKDSYENRLAEEARLAEETRLAEEQAKLEEEEARLKAEEEARLKAEEEARLEAEEEARLAAEEAAKGPIILSTAADETLENEEVPILDTKVEETTYSQDEKLKEQKREEDVANTRRPIHENDITEDQKITKSSTDELEELLKPINANTFALESLENPFSVDNIKPDDIEVIEEPKKKEANDELLKEYYAQTQKMTAAEKAKINKARMQGKPVQVKPTIQVASTAKAKRKKRYTKGQIFLILIITLACLGVVILAAMLTLFIK